MTGDSGAETVSEADGPATPPTDGWVSRPLRPIRSPIEALTLLAQLAVVLGASAVALGHAYLQSYLQQLGLALGDLKLDPVRVAGLVAIWLVPCILVVAALLPPEGGVWRENKNVPFFRRAELWCGILGAAAVLVFIWSPASDAPVMLASVLLTVFVLSHPVASHPLGILILVLTLVLCAVGAGWYRGVVASSATGSATMTTLHQIPGLEGAETTDGLWVYTGMLAAFRDDDTLVVLRAGVTVLVPVKEIVNIQIPVRANSGGEGGQGPSPAPGESPIASLLAP